MSEESFSDELRKISQDKAAADEARKALQREATAGAEAWAKEARAKAKMILETIIVPRVDALNRVLAENEGLRGGVVENGERGEDNFSQLIGYNRRDNFLIRGIQGVITVGVSLAHEKRALELSVHCQMRPDRGATTAGVCLDDKHKLEDPGDMVGIGLWYEKHLKNCYRRVLELAEVASR